MAAVALASCASEDAVEQSAVQVEQSPIAFGTYSSGVSRAMITSKKDFQESGFKVWANVNREGTKNTESLFSAQNVKYDEGNSIWYYAPVKYWPTSADATVDFYAVHIDQKNPQNYVDLNTDFENKPQFYFVVNNKVKDQSDLLWAKPLLGQKRSDYTTGQTVDFAFQHALSGHFFTFKTENDESANIKKLTVNSITLTGYFAPKAMFNPNATDIKDMWHHYEGDWEKRSYTISTENGGIDETIFTTENFADGAAHVITSKNSDTQSTDAQYNDGGSMESAPKCDYIMVLPFNHEKVADPGKQSCTITVNYTIYTEDEGGNLVPQTYEVAVDHEFDYSKPGYLHQGNIVLSLDQIDFSADLLEWNVEDHSINM